MRRSVLVWDDDVSSRLLAVRILRSWGHEPRRPGDRAQALGGPALRVVIGEDDVLMREGIALDRRARRRDWTSLS